MLYLMRLPKLSGAKPRDVPLKQIKGDSLAVYRLTEIKLQLHFYKLWLCSETKRKKKLNASEDVLLVHGLGNVTYSLLNLSNAWKVSGEKSIILLLSKYLNGMIIEILC